jgi:NADH-quinone oxidoreductase subunit E
MFYLFMQTLFWIILAFVLGLIVGWWLRGRFLGEQQSEQEAVPITKVAAASVAAKPAPAAVEPAPAVVEPAPAAPQAVVESAAKVTDVVEAPAVDEQWKPLVASGENKDDLKRIKGIGPVIEKSLNGLGIFTFQQISDFSPDNVKWVDSHINFPGRINREEWVSQATELAAGGSTSFSARVDKGDVSY